ncbi:MAG: tetratricopeptide repeat protein [Desulfuromonadaceae bacterium]
MNNRLIFITTAVFFLSLALLSIIQVEETDTWLHLSMGREIFNLRALPATEPFTYPSFGRPFLYTSWLFGVVLYLTYLAAGYTGVIVFKAALVTLAVIVFYKDAVSPYKERLVVIVILTFFVFLNRYHFVERPDMVMMVCLSFTVYALNAYLFQNRKYLYALPAVALVWACSHSSIVLMPVPFLAFIVGGIIHRSIGTRIPLLNHVPSREQIKTISVMFLLSAVTTFITPNFIAQFTYGQSILAGQWYKQNIIELDPLTQMGLVEVGTGIAITLFSFFLNRKRFSPIHFLMILPFWALPFSARRFLFLFWLIMIPVIARNLAGFASESVRFQSIIRHPLAALVTIVWITVYSVLGLTGVQPIGYEFKKFGFGVNETTIPAGTVRYMDNNGIYGKMFNPFHWGGYLIWTGYPQRTVFIDPRGYLSEDLLEQSSLVGSGNIWTLEQLFRRFGFDAVIMDYPTREDGFSKLGGIVLPGPNWALVYWDETSLLYLRREGRYQPIIQRDEYRFVSPADGRKGISKILGNPAMLVGVERELKRSIQENLSPRGIGLLGDLYSKTGRYGEAITEYSKVLEYARQVDRLSAYTGLGTVYYQLGDLSKSLSYYEKAVKIQKDAAFLYNLATIYAAIGDDAKAIKTLLEAIKVDPGYERAHTLLDETYRRLGQKKTDK